MTKKKAKVDFSEPMYPIGVVAKKVGISTQLIRFYEKRGLVQSHQLYKSKSRFYTEDEIEKLIKTRDMRKAGLAIENIRGILKKKK